MSIIDLLEALTALQLVMDTVPGENYRNADIVPFVHAARKIRPGAPILSVGSGLGATEAKLQHALGGEVAGRSS